MSSEDGGGCSDSRSRDHETNQLLEELDHVSDVERRQELCNEIITRTLPVADRLAARYAGRGMPADDLRQVARTALVQAMRRFRGVGEHAFLAYAVPTIRGELRRYFRDVGWVVRPPRRIQEARLAVNGAISDLRHSRGGEPSAEDLATETGLDLDSVLAARNVDHCYRPESLDRPVGDDRSSTVGSTHGSEDDGFDQAEARVMVRPLIDGLAPRDRKLILLRFFEGLTQSETGKRIGISQMQVSRVEAKILRGFRESLVA